MPLQFADAVHQPAFYIQCVDPKGALPELTLRPRAALALRLVLRLPVNSSVWLPPLPLVGLRPAVGVRTFRLRVSVVNEGVVITL